MKFFLVAMLVLGMAPTVEAQRTVVVLMPSPSRADVRAALQLEFDGIEARAVFIEGDEAEAELQGPVLRIVIIEPLAPVVLRFEPGPGQEPRVLRLRDPYDVQDARALAAAAVSIVIGPLAVAPARLDQSSTEPLEAQPAPAPETIPPSTGAEDIQEQSEAVQEQPEEHGSREAEASGPFALTVAFGVGQFTLDGDQKSLATFYHVSARFLRNSLWNFVGLSLLATLRLSYQHDFDRFALYVNPPGLDIAVGRSTWPMLLTTRVAALLVTDTDWVAAGLTASIGLVSRFDNALQFALRWEVDQAWRLDQSETVQTMAGVASLTSKF